VLTSRRQHLAQDAVSIAAWPSCKSGHLLLSLAYPQREMHYLSNSNPHKNSVLLRNAAFFNPNWIGHLESHGARQECARKSQRERKRWTVDVGRVTVTQIIQLTCCLSYTLALSSPPNSHKWPRPILYTRRRNNTRVYRCIIFFATC
jgi:hypothetical protein